MRAFGGFVISAAAIGGSCVLASGCGSEDSSALEDNPGAPAQQDGGLHFGSIRVGDGAACYAQVRKGESLPLDIYVLLDKSSSMMEVTPSGFPKWDLIRAALESFLGDPGSTGIGIGLQYFPLRKPGVPAVCTTHAECGAGGPCFTTACTNQTTLTLCESDADCGPRAQGACERFGACELYPAGGSPVFCGPIGAQCNQGLGQCLDIPDRWCANGTECTAGAYSTPAVPITALPAGAQPLITSLRATMPEGRTPTAPALQGALDQARSWAASHPDHKVVAVLATDGLPTECSPTDIGQVAAIAGGGSGATIPVFVIGVFTAEDTESPANLNAIAQAGGTGQAFIVQTDGDVTKEFLTALDSVRGSALLSCELQVPPGNGTGALDYFQVNLQMSPATGDAKQLIYVRNSAGCPGSPGVGWYYDVDPSVQTPTKIIVCPDVCSSFQTQPGAKINLQIGCETIIH
jgi:hypothetical protein